jgi:hypothetical protein
MTAGNGHAPLAPVSEGHACDALCTAQTCKCPPCRCRECIARTARALAARRPRPRERPTLF